MKPMANLTPDLSRGFDVMRRNTVLEHFTSHEAAKRYAATIKGAIVRYWAAKPAQ